MSDDQNSTTSAHHQLVKISHGVTISFMRIAVEAAVFKVNARVIVSVVD